MATGQGKCSICPEVGPLDAHHKFARYSWRKKLYGSLLDHPANIQWACPKCHASHASPKLEIWDEAKFCAALGIPPRSKEAITRAALTASMWLAVSWALWDCSGFIR